VKSNVRNNVKRAAKMLVALTNINPKPAAALPELIMPQPAQVA